MGNSNSKNTKGFNAAAVLFEIIGSTLYTFRKYLVFEGRMARKNFWMAIGGHAFVMLVFFLLGKFTGFTPFFKLFVLYALAIICPVATAGIRRIHDIGWNGLFFATVCIPIAGWLFLIYLWIRPGNIKENKFGPVPVTRNRYVRERVL